MISIHQSQFLPWIPYFFKIIKSDIFIIMDDVQFQKNGVQNRNSIKTPSGSAFLTIPVSTKSDTLINQVSISNRVHLKKFLKTLQANYGKSKYFNNIFPEIENIINSHTSMHLNDLNIELLNMVIKFLGVKTEIKYSSSFSLKSKKDDLVLDLIVANGENEYITGEGGLEYMDLNKFDLKEIKLYKYSFDYKEYPQLWEKNGFVPYLSIIDLLFNDLPNAYEYIEKSGQIEEIGR